MVTFLTNEVLLARSHLLFISHAAFDQFIVSFMGMPVSVVVSMLSDWLERCDDLVSSFLHEVEISEVALSRMGYDGSFNLSFHLFMWYSCRWVRSLVAGSDGGQKLSGQVCLLFQPKVLHLDLAKRLDFLLAPLVANGWILDTALLIYRLWLSKDKSCFSTDWSEMFGH